MLPHIRAREPRGCAGIPGAPMRTLTRYTLGRVPIRKRLTVIGLLVIMIGGAVTSGALQ